MYEPQRYKSGKIKINAWVSYFSTSQEDRDKILAEEEAERQREEAIKKAAEERRKQEEEEARLAAEEAER